MKDFQKIKSQIESGNYAPAYFLYGEESYFIDEIARLLEERVIDPSLRDFNQTILYGGETEPSTVLDTLARFPMMSDKQLVVLREAQKMKDFDAIAPYFEKPSDTNVFVILYKGKAPDKRKKAIKTILANSVAAESKPLYENQIPDWIRTYVSTKGYSIDQRSATLLAQYLGTDIGKITNELSKLFINLPAGASITPDDIEKHIGISKDYNIFELQKAMSFRNMDSIFTIITYFQANMKSNPIQMLLPTLHSFFAKLFVIKSLSTKDSGTIAKEIGVNPFFVKEYLQADKAFSTGQIFRAFDILLEYDLRTKGYKNDGESDEGLLEELMIKIMA